MGKAAPSSGRTMMLGGLALALLIDWETRLQSEVGTVSTIPEFLSISSSDSRPSASNRIPLLRTQLTANSRSFHSIRDFRSSTPTQTRIRAAAGQAGFA